MASKVTTKMLSGLDYVGEGLADAMGITSPRFNSQETNKGVNNHIHQTQIVSSSQPYSYYQQKSANGMYNSRQNFKATAYNELVNDVAKGLGISKKADELSQIV